MVTKHPNATAWQRLAYEALRQAWLAREAAPWDARGPWPSDALLAHLRARPMEEPQATWWTLALTTARSELATALERSPGSSHDEPWQVWSALPHEAIPSWEQMRRRVEATPLEDRGALLCALASPLQRLYGAEQALSLALERLDSPGALEALGDMTLQLGPLSEAERCGVDALLNAHMPALIALASAPSSSRRRHSAYTLLPLYALCALGHRSAGHQALVQLLVEEGVEDLLGRHGQALLGVPDPSEALRLGMRLSMRLTPSLIVGLVERLGPEQGLALCAQALKAPAHRADLNELAPTLLKVGSPHLVTLLWTLEGEPRAAALTHELMTSLSAQDAIEGLLRLCARPGARRRFALSWLRQLCVSPDPRAELERRVDERAQDALATLVRREALALCASAKGLTSDSPARLTPWLMEHALPQGVEPDQALQLLAQLERRSATRAAQDEQDAQARLRQRLDGPQAGRWAWAILSSWARQGAPPQARWVTEALVALGGPEQIAAAQQALRRPERWIHRDPSQATRAQREARQEATCQALLDALARMESPEALAALQTIALGASQHGERQARLARDLLAQAQRRLGLDACELADRSVPTLGLDASGSRVVGQGDRQVTMVAHPLGELTLLDAQGRRLRRTPGARQGDGGGEADQVSKTLQLTRRQLRALVAQLTRRHERALCARRAWEAQAWRTWMWEHPVTRQLTCALVWEVVQTGQLVLPCRDGSCVGLDYEPLQAPTQGWLRLAHPVTMAPEAVEGWSQMMMELELRQPFAQLGRPHRAVSVDELEIMLEALRAKRPTTWRRELRQALERQGWTRERPGEHRRAGAWPEAAAMRLREGGQPWLRGDGEPPSKAALCPVARSELWLWLSQRLETGQ